MATTIITPVRVTKSMKFAAIVKFLSNDEPSVIFHAEDKEKHSSVTFTRADAMAFLNAEIAALAKKNSGERKQTDTQKANEGYKTLILKFLEEKEEAFVPSDENPEFMGMTCTEILKGIPEFTNSTTVLFSNQKVSSLCNALKEEGKAIKDAVKGRSVFKAACIIAEEDVEEAEEEEVGED